MPSLHPNQAIRIVVWLCYGKHFFIDCIEVLQYRAFHHLNLGHNSQQGLFRNFQFYV